MARYGYGMSVSGSRTPVVASSTPAPSGLPVSSTPSIVVVGSGGVPSAIYNIKELEEVIGSVSSLDWTAGLPPFYCTTQAVPSADLYFFLGPNATLGDFEGSTYYINGSNWQIFRLYDNEGATLSSVGTNPSTNVDYIPTSGWTPSITITTA